MQLPMYHYTVELLGIALLLAALLLEGGVALDEAAALDVALLDTGGLLLTGTLLDIAALEEAAALLVSEELAGVDELTGIDEEAPAVDELAAFELLVVFEEEAVADDEAVTLELGTAGSTPASSANDLSGIETSAPVMESTNLIVLSQQSNLQQSDAKGTSMATFAGKDCTLPRSLTYFADPVSKNIFICRAFFQITE